MEINERGKDKHGHILHNHTFLNDIFKYQNVGVPSKNKFNATAESPELAEFFKENLAEVYRDDQLTDERIKDLEDNCEGKGCDELDDLKDLRKEYFEQGWDRSSLDTSIALFFGNKTTIGQVCSYARGGHAQHDAAHAPMDVEAGRSRRNLALARWSGGDLWGCLSMATTLTLVLACHDRLV